MNVPVGGAVGTNLVSGFESAYGAQLIGCTVMRVRGWWSGEGLASGEQMLAGIRVWTESSGPFQTDQGPIQDPHADWMYYETMPGPLNTEGTHFDVRSMRKFEELGQGLIMAFEGNNAAGATVPLSVSVLLALP